MTPPKFAWPTLRTLVCTLLVITSYALVTLLPSWGTLARWLPQFLQDGPLTVILLTTGLLGLLRKFALKKPFRFVSAFLIYWLFFQFIFYSRWMPYGTQPTFLAILTFFHVT